ncbi:MAG TPA: DUF423 domain-containing protein [Chitinophagaceae bacterium]|nr:DUF423 domain-containing protein [Chitinophagaceae bacterium]
MHKTALITGTIFAGVAVALGAFGAHGLQKITSDEKIIQGFKTAVEYQLWHALALIITGILAERFDKVLLKWATRCFIAGIIFFSGSLYLLSFLKIQGSSLVKIAGPLTPLGGLLFIVGWVIVLVALLSARNTPEKKR